MTVRELYHKMSTATLLELRDAFTVDAGEYDHNPALRGFTAQRLRWIAEELQRREPRATTEDA